AQPQPPPVPANPPVQSQAQQPVAPVPALSRPPARPAVAAPPAAPPRQEGTQNAQAPPTGQCAVARPKPGLQVYLVTCASSWAMIGRTVDTPSGWTISEGVNSTAAVEYFMKSRYAR